MHPSFLNKKLKGGNFSAGHWHGGSFQPRASEAKRCPSGTEAGTPSKQPRARGDVTSADSQPPIKPYPLHKCPLSLALRQHPRAAAPCSLTPARPPRRLSHQHSHPGHCLWVHGYTWLSIRRTIHPFQAQGNFPNTPLGPRHYMHVKAAHRGSPPAA